MKKYLLSFTLMLFSTFVIAMDEKEREARIAELDRIFTNITETTPAEEKEGREREFVNKLTAFIKAGGTLNEDQGKKLLYNAIYSSSLLIVQTLIETAGVLPNVVFETGDTPLILATGMGNEPLVHYLVNLQKKKGKNISVNAKHLYDDLSALELLANNIHLAQPDQPGGKVERTKLLHILTLLLEAGADETGLILYVSDPHSDMYDADIASYYKAFKVEKGEMDISETPKIKMNAQQVNETLSTLHKIFDDNEKEDIVKQEKKIIALIKKYAADGGDLNTYEELDTFFANEGVTLPILQSLIKDGKINPNNVLVGHGHRVKRLLLWAIDNYSPTLIEYIIDATDFNDKRIQTSPLLTTTAFKIVYTRKRPQTTLKYLNILRKLILQGADITKDKDFSTFIVQDKANYDAEIKQTVDKALRDSIRKP